MPRRQWEPLKPGRDHVQLDGPTSITPARAEYTGLAVGTASDGNDYIYAANEGTNPGIQVFNSSFQQVTKLGNFMRSLLPAGFVPYGVRDLSLGTGRNDDA